jgi:hypothetical protein
VVTKNITCTNLSIFQFDLIHSFVELFTRLQTFWNTSNISLSDMNLSEGKNLEQYLNLKKLLASKNLSRMFLESKKTPKIVGYG